MTSIQVLLGLTNVAAVCVPFLCLLEFALPLADVVLTLVVGMFVEAGSSMLFEVADVKPSVLIPMGSLIRVPVGRCFDTCC